MDQNEVFRSEVFQSGAFPGEVFQDGVSQGVAK